MRSDEMVLRAQKTPNPLDISGSVERVCEVIRSYPLGDILSKKFFDISF